MEFLDKNDPQDKKHLDYYNSYASELVAIKDSYSAFEFTQDMQGSGIEKAQVYSTLDKRDGSNIVKISLQVSTGEVFTAFEGTLTK